MKAGYTTAIVPIAWTVGLASANAGGVHIQPFGPQRVSASYAISGESPSRYRGPGPRPAARSSLLYSPQLFSDRQPHPIQLVSLSRRPSSSAMRTSSRRRHSFDWSWSRAPFAGVDGLGPVRAAHRRRVRHRRPVAFGPCGHSRCRVWCGRRRCTCRSPVQNPGRPRMCGESDGAPGVRRRSDPLDLARARPGRYLCLGSRVPFDRSPLGLDLGLGVQGGPAKAEERRGDDGTGRSGLAR